MAIVHSVVSWLMKKRYHQIQLFMKYPHEVQTELFKKLISTAKDTEWGHRYDYKSIKSYDDFRNRVPINDYDSIRDDVERIMKGKQNILWPTDIRLFAKSSGTTSAKSKFIPVSEESIEECHYKGGKDMLGIYCHNFPETGMFDGRGLAMGGSHTIREVNNDEFYIGDLSALIIQKLPNWAEFIRVPKRSLALMDEWEEKIEKMAHATIPHNVTSISGVPSWTLLLLNRILDITKKDNILEVWPNLEVFFHGGVNFSPYRSQFEALIPSPTMYYVDTYSASEGFFGLQDGVDRDDMLLMLDYGIFYEFIPMTELDSEQPRAIPLREVEAGINYALVITTNAGLWRYMIGDTVKFTSVDPYRIKITGRTKSFINAFGEELIVDNAEKALNVATSKCDAIITDYTAAPVYLDGKENAAHEWLIEFTKEPENLEFFIETLDNALKSLNSDYEAKRYHDMILRKPIVRKLPPKTFYKWMKKRGKLGGQHKVPRLANERSYVEEILEMIK
jgi:hypothetical protein